MRRWLDRNLSTPERIDALLTEMTVEDKAGQLFHTMIAPGKLDEPAPAFSLPSAREYIVDRRMTHFNVVGSPDSAGEFAQWHNEVQQLAVDTHLGIPVTFSSDPRHAFTDNPGAGFAAGPFSQWPEPLGIAAIGDTERAREFGDIVRQEYVAVGLRAALHPQVDLATEPRWARQVGTFGEDPDLSARLGAAYITGLQGESFGTTSVSAMVKHFPGGGPQKDGEDPHFSYGREQVYPGGDFELHLKPFIAAFDAGVRQVMPYYGMPIGTDYEEVAFGFNRSVLTGLLRERFGYDGVVCTDWGLLTDAVILGDLHAARAWGVEHLSTPQRLALAFEAGADQFGGEAIPEVLVRLVADSVITQERLDVSVRRVLREKFELGLFDDPFVDVGRAAEVVGNEDFVTAGARAQRDSITVLTNVGLLPVPHSKRVYAEGIDPDVLGRYATVVLNPADADLAILRLQAPFEHRATAFENFFHAGSLDFTDDMVAHVSDIAAQVPTIIDVFADRPAILTPFVSTAAAITVNWGADGSALLDVLTGTHAPRGRLPFDLPRSMSAVVESKPDVPFDTADPLFRFGHGLTF